MEKNQENWRKILVVGSIAFDIIFDLSSALSDQIQIVDGKTGRQNLMFHAKKKDQFYGGTAGNIGYGLGLLGEKPLVFGVAGKDFFSGYEKHLVLSGADVRTFIDLDGFTATYYGMTDTKGEQMGVWQPNAYGEHIERVSLKSTISLTELENISFAIFSPGTPASTIKHMNELRAHNKTARVIFDPGQTIASLFDKRSFNEALDQSDIFISNDVEMSHAKKYFGFKPEDAVLKGKIVIETQGEKGSILYEKNRGKNIPAFKPKKMRDATGAGDAYRAGLLFGLSRGMPLEQSALCGAKIASRCIECVSGQSYLFSKNEVL